jgi:hypothetical protein
MAAEPTEEELRAYEDEISRITSTQLLVQTAASLLNVGGRRLGLAQGAEQDRDLEQVRDAIDAVSALLPILERRMPAAQARPLRDALSQLQMAYARLAQAPPSEPSEQEAPSQQAPGAEQPAGPPGVPGAADSPAAERSQPAQGEDPADGPGPAQRSGRLWVPGS